MNLSTSIFQHPLVERYTSDVMKGLFSSDRKYRTWRQIWIAVPTIMKGLGANIPITDEQLEAMDNAWDKIDYEYVKEEEKKTRHDVTAHIRAFAKACPIAKPIIHLGMTSCCVTDNAELIIYRDALEIVALKLARVIYHLSNFASSYSDEPILGLTHLQPAQLTTVGKRACLWINDLLMDLEDVGRMIKTMRLRGLKGAVGTQGSYLSYFDGDAEKVKELEKRFADFFEFSGVYRITGQTYTRKLDTKILQVLSSFGASVHKMTLDLRILQSRREIREPLGKDQVGSSIMAHKQNPRYCESANSIAKYLMIQDIGGNLVHATQLFERTLDDSMMRRMNLPEAFLAADAILMILQYVCQGLVVNPYIIEANIKNELPFMAMDNMIAAMVKSGGDRQDVHERLRVMSLAASKRIDVGESNNLVEQIKTDPYFTPIHPLLEKILDPKTFLGRAKDQVEEFLVQEVRPALLPYEESELGLKIELDV